LGGIYRRCGRHPGNVGKPCFLNGSRRAFAGAFAAQPAFVKINVSEIIFDDNSVKSANFPAFGTGDTGGAASFPRYGAFVFIDARYEDTPVLWSFFAQFDNLFRAGFNAGAAGSAFIVVNSG
jgi:hypothetical protein